MKKLLILEPCIVSGGLTAARGDVIDADERTTYILISSKRALDLSTKEGKAVQEEIAAEVAKAKPAAVSVKK